MRIEANNQVIAAKEIISSYANGVPFHGKMYKFNLEKEEEIYHNSMEGKRLIYSITEKNTSNKLTGEELQDFAQSFNKAHQDKCSLVSTTNTVEFSTEWWLQIRYYPEKPNGSSDID